MSAVRYLIIGASGFIGRHLYRKLGPERAIATYYRAPFAGGIWFDASRMRLAELLQSRYPAITHAFILHGITSFEACAKDPAATALINIESVRRIIDELMGCGIVPVFASSDAVFDGINGGRTEKDAATPITAYGHQKVAIENYLAEKCPHAIVVRISKILSTRPEVQDMLADWLQNLEVGAPIRCAYDHIFSPADIEDINDALVQLVEKKLDGLFHVCGPSPISRLELLQTFVREIGRYRPVTSQIIPCSLLDFAFSEPRSLNTSMSAEKLYAALGIRFKTPSRICELRARAQYEKE